MRPVAYYNEIDPYAAQWLRNLIAAGHIAPGDVDERSIEDVTPDDLRNYTQCHFFAGIGVWSYALRQAGWPDDKPVWTGSCPCQPFSTAGKSAGFADERHLWPSFFHLIEQLRPPIIFGEQVASKAIDTWIDLVQSDMEGMGYAFANTPFPSAGVGAPHARDRIFWVADSDDYRQQPGERRSGSIQSSQERDNAGRCCKAGSLGDTSIVSLRTYNGKSRASGESQRAARGYGVFGKLAYSKYQQCKECVSRCGKSDCEETSGKTVKFTGFRLSGGMANASRTRLRPFPEKCTGQSELPEKETNNVSTCGGVSSAGEINGFWSDADWLLCRDGKWRPVEPGTFPLANGVTNRVGRLRAYGNAINAEAAKEFIAAFLDVRRGQ